MSVISSTILARWRVPGQVRRPARCWVVHDMEAPEQSTIAEGVGRYFQRVTHPASTHFGVDNNSFVRYAYDNDKVYGAYGLNSDSLHVEHAGYARQSRSEWLDAYGVAMLDLSARAFVEIGYKKHGIPPVLLTPAQTADGRSRGITSHVNSTKGWGVRGGHTDPGSNFPWDYYLERINVHIKAAGGKVSPPKPVVTERVLKRPMKGQEVAEWQKDLNKVLFYKIKVDGSFDGKTEAATLIFQKDAGITQDAIVGPNTRASMKSYLNSNKKVQFKLGPFNTKKSRAKVTYPFPGSIYKRGDHGTNVRRIQQWLKDRGYAIAVDGWFGPQTQDRVMKFQVANGIKQHGRVNKRTWKAVARLNAND